MLEDSKKFLEITKIVVSYYQAFPFDPTLEDYNDWLTSLPTAPLKSHFIKIGFDSCKTTLNFKRFYFEVRGYSLDDYLKINLSQEDYNIWNNIKIID